MKFKLIWVCVVTNTRILNNISLPMRLINEFFQEFEIPHFRRNTQFGLDIFVNLSDSDARNWRISAFWEILRETERS